MKNSFLILFLFLGLHLKGQNVRMNLQSGGMSEITAIAGSPTGNIIALGFKSGSIKLIHNNSLKEINTIVAHSGEVAGLSFSPNGKTLLSYGTDKTLNFWTVETGVWLHRSMGDEVISSARFSDNENCYSVEGKQVLSHNILSKAKKSVFNVNAKNLYKAVISSDGKNAVAANYQIDKQKNGELELTVYDLKTGKTVATYLCKAPELDLPYKIKSAWTTAMGDILVDTRFSMLHLDRNKKNGDVSFIALDGKSKFIHGDISVTPDKSNVWVPCNSSKRIGKINTEKNQFDNYFDYSPHFSFLNLNSSVENQFFISTVGSKNELFVVDAAFKKIIVVDSDNHTLLREREITRIGINFTQWSKIHNSILIGFHNSQKIQCWDFKTLSFKYEIDSVATKYGSLIALSDDGNLLAVRMQGKAGTKNRAEDNDESEIGIFEIKTGRRIKTVSDPNAKEAVGINFISSGNALVVGYLVSLPHLYDISGSEKVISAFKTIELKERASFGEKWVFEAAKPNSMIIGGLNSIMLFDYKNNQKISSIELTTLNADSYFYRSAYDKNNHAFAFTYLDMDGIQKLTLFDAKMGKPMQTMKIHNTLEFKSGRKNAHEYEYPVAFSQNGLMLAVGSTDNHIEIWNTATGKPLKIFSGHSDAISSLQFMENDSYLLSASMDGSVRIWTVGTEKWVALSVDAVSQKWIVYNQDGFWDASNNGGELVAMVKGTECWNIDQFAIIGNRPDIVLEQRKCEDKELLRNYKQRYNRRIKKAGIKNPLLNYKLEVPEAKILSATLNENRVSLHLQFSDRFSGLKRYNIYVNDVPIFGSEGKAISGNQIEEKVEISLSSGNNKIECSCFNNEMVESFRDVRYFRYKSQNEPNLYFLAFGISEYKNPAYNLQFAHKDALDLEKAMKGLKGYNRIYTKVYTNKNVTTENIANAKEFLANAKIDDTFVLFIAGHGMYDRKGEPEYYYLTYHADTTNLAQTATRFELIEDLLQGIPPRNKLFLMDACESGEIDEDDYKTLTGFQTLSGLNTSFRGFKSTSTSTSLSAQGGSLSGAETNRTQIYERNRYIFNDLSRRSGAIIFSSSRGSEASQERKDLKQGLFTHFIMKALTSTESDFDKNGIISTDELRQYVSEQVAKASGDLQHPTVDRDNIYQKFGFGVK